MRGSRAWCAVAIVLMTALGGAGHALGEEPDAGGGGATPSGTAGVAVGTFTCFVSVVHPPDGTGIVGASASLSFLRDQDVVSANRGPGPGVDVFLGSGEGAEEACERFTERVVGLGRSRGCTTGPIAAFDAAAGNATEKHWSFTTVCTGSDPSLEWTLRDLIKEVAGSPQVLQQSAGSRPGPSRATGGCAALMRQYNMALEFARRCDPSLSDDPCTVSVLDSLVCNCWTIVASGTHWLDRLSTVESQLRSTGCLDIFACGGPYCSPPPPDWRGVCAPVQAPGARQLGQCIPNPIVPAAAAE